MPPEISPSVYAITIPVIAGLLLGMKAPERLWRLPIWGAWLTSFFIAALILALPLIHKQLGLAAMRPASVAAVALTYAWLFSLTSGLCMISHKEKRKAGGRVLLWSLAPPLTTVVLMVGMTVAGFFPLYKNTENKSDLKLRPSKIAQLLLAIVVR